MSSIGGSQIVTHLIGILETIKTTLIQKSDQNIHQDASNCTLKKISQGSMPLACVQLISLFLYEKKTTFFHSQWNQNIH